MTNETPSRSRRDFLASVAALAAIHPRLLLAAKEGPVARTAYGSVQGTVNQLGVVAFKGVPFAATTGGANRFHPPIPPAPWTGVREAANPGPISPQNDDDKIGAYAKYTQSEDCLNLNIWTPAADGGRRPVIMFMHGGGFTTGSGSLGLYDGSILAKAHEVVVVTINYRLGLLGFPPFQLHGAGISNNLGLLDSIAALKWIRENISGFGGDPSRVLQCGQSAGAMISAGLGVLPAASGLYQRAVPMSAQYLVTVDRDRQARYTRELLDALGLGPKDAARLQSLPVADLLRAQGTVREKGLAAPGIEDQKRWPFMLNRDDVVFRDEPCELIKRGKYADVATLVGATTEELLLSPAQEKANPTARERSLKSACLGGLTAQLGTERAGRIWDLYAAEYPMATEVDICGMIGTDQLYRMPAIRIAEARPGRSWSYAAAYRGTGPFFTGAHHAIDLPFWFGTLAYPQLAGFFLGHPATEAELALSSLMQKTLAGFARDGRAPWPKYDLTHRPTMVFDLESKVVNDPASATRAIWDGIVT
ncbi:MAG: carboxylesterase family protein [Gemmatimonadota bacterium]